MNKLLIIENELYNDNVYKLCDKKEWDIIVIQKKFLKISDLKKIKIEGIILVSTRILSVNSQVSKTIKNYFKRSRPFFVEVSYIKSKISQEKRFSDAIINGVGKNFLKVLKKII